MVEHQDVAIQYIHYIWCIVLIHCGILDRNILEIADCIEGCIAIESAIVGAFALDIEIMNEVVDSLSYRHLSPTLLRHVYI